MSDKPWTSGPKELLDHARLHLASRTAFDSRIAMISVVDPTRRPLARSPAPAAMKALIGLLIAATLLFGSACAKTDWIDRTLVTVDVTGTWAGSVGGTGSGGKPPDFLFELEQQGSTVKGVMRFSAGGASQGVSYGSRISQGPLAGTVTGDVFRFRLTNGTLDGELTVSGDEMAGQVSWSGSRPLSLRRVDSGPVSPPR